MVTLDLADELELDRSGPVSPVAVEQGGAARRAAGPGGRSLVGAGSGRLWVAVRASA